MSSSRPTFFARYARWILIVAAICFPLAVSGSIVAMHSNRNDVKEWLPESFEETQQYQEFQRDFNNDTFILASWEGCTLDDQRVDRFIEKLQAQMEARPPSQRYLAKLISGRSVIDELTRPPSNLGFQQAVRRLKGSLVGPDGRQTCAVLTVSDFGKEHLRPMLAEVEQAAVDSGVPAGKLRMAGPPVDNVAIDQVSESMREQLMVVAGVVGLGLSWWYLRDWRLTWMVFIAGAYSATLCLALVAATGGTMNSVLFTMPAVVYTAGLSCAIHLVNYYRHTRPEGGLEGAAERGLRAAWLPCLLSAGTTSLGLISLCTSAIVPIRTFGFYTSIGVMAAVGLIYLYLPAALQVWPPPLHVNPHRPDEDHSPLDPGHRQRMRRLAERIISRPRVVWAVFAVLLVACGAGLHRMRTTVNLMSLFSPKAQIIENYRWLEEKLGPMVPMEVVLELDERDCNLTIVERLELVSRIQKAIEQDPHVGSTMSAATFVPDLSPPKKSGLRGTLLTPSVWRRTLNRRLQEHWAELLAGDYVAEHPDRHEQKWQKWRISVRVAALQDLDYGAFIHTLREHVEPIIQSQRQANVRGIVGVVYTGLVPVVYKAERALLDGLIESFFWAFVMMAAVMTIVFRDLRAGLYTMLPNVWPVAVVFGLMGWLGIALDIGTMMTASVAMGVCVDDTVHFANWFRRATRAGLERREAVITAFENSAGAIYQSTVIVAVGLGIFALSEFMPTRRFGYLMGILLFFGLVADLVLTPAMLSGPIGRFFCRHCEPPDAEPHAEWGETSASSVGREA